MHLGMQPLINRLNSTKATCVFPDLFIDNPGTPSSKLPTIAPILLHVLIPGFLFRYISCVADVMLKEFGFEFIPYNQIRLSLVHVLCLGLFGSRAPH